jgi:DNA-directed RNA polymerase sigma subunit (sigma70/sigma32)
VNGKDHWLALWMEEGDPWLETYFQLALQAPLHSKADETELARRAVRGDESARTELAATHRRLVIAIAAKYVRSCVAQSNQPSAMTSPTPASTWSLGPLI